MLSAFPLVLYIKWANLSPTLIWNLKPPNIKLSTVIGRIKDGGLSMPYFDIIDTSLKAGWVKRLFDSQSQSWKTIPFSLLDGVGGPLLLKCNFSLRTFSELPLLPAFLPRCFQCLGEHIQAHILLRTLPPTCRQALAFYVSRSFKTLH